MLLNKKNLRRYYAAIFIGFNLLPNTGMSYEKDKTYNITILHTNDHHGAFWEDYNEGTGISARMTLIESIRKEVLNNGGEVLLLDAGDINTGDARSEVLFAEPDIKGMNLIGYDAMVIGDHEFDNPLPILKQQASWAKFPFISANIYEKNTDNRLFKPFTLLKKSDLNIAVIGLSTENITRFNHIEHIDNIDVRPPEKETLKVINQLEQLQIPDITIGLSHLGYDQSVKSTSKASDDVSLANKLPKGTFDLIIGGHSHHTICIPSIYQYRKINKNTLANCLPHYQNGTWIMQAGDSGKYVGRADFEYLNGEIKLVHYELIPVNIRYQYRGPTDEVYIENIGAQISPSKTMLELLKPYNEIANNKIVNDRVGFVDKRLSTTVVNYDENYESKKTRLYELLMAAIIEKTAADLAIIGPESTSESIPSGKITYLQILKSLRYYPFIEYDLSNKDANKVVFIDLKGYELKKYIQKMYNKSFQTNVTFDINNDSSLSNIKIKNIPLDENKTYRLATLKLYSLGLFGYPRIYDHENFMETQFLSSFVFNEYIKKHTPIKADDYRPSINTNLNNKKS
ncbi:5'-nucleotidase C-terminal domain-containing protein [Thorsellia kenyensis]|uniref:5'-nucleotidase C-terminal domain-containing protein n=1 Tax=Thorsellia kenyensis TaxID=1549888 RepID=A0ABV6CCE9_9GAMM